MPRNYKRKTNKANMPFSTYQEAAKRVIDHGESLQKVAADFDVSKIKISLCIKINLLKLLFIKVCLVYKIKIYYLIIVNFYFY